MSFLFYVRQNAASNVAYSATKIEKLHRTTK